MSKNLIEACDMLAGGLRVAIEAGKIDTKNIAPVLFGMIEEAEAAIAQDRAVLEQMPDVCACCDAIPTHECQTCHMEFCAEHSEFCRHCGANGPMIISNAQIVRYAQRLQGLCRKAAVVIREMEDNMRNGQPGFSCDFIDELQSA
jgi:hypothetical protein